MNFATPTLFLAAAASLASFSGAFAADHYSASSNTAMSVTGDIDMDDFSITFENGQSLDFSDLVADHFTVDGKQVPASVYRVKQPGDPKLQNANRLCGQGKVSYVASWTAGEGETAVAVFTGGHPPKGDDESCAIYSYTDPE